MRHRLRHRRETPVELNVIPLIDVVFFLLVFYVITTSFVQEAAVPVDRPGSSQAQAVTGAWVAVAITKGGTIQVGERIVDLPMLGDAVAAALRDSAAVRVVVVPDREVPTGLLLRVMDACRLAGATSVDVAAVREGG